MEDQNIPSCFQEPVLGYLLHPEESERSMPGKKSGFSPPGMDYQQVRAYRREKEQKEERMKLMKAALIFVVGLTLAVAVNAKTLETVKKAGENTVTVILEKDPPASGDNAVTVSVKDPKGKAVTSARVAIEYGMPAMMGMPAMKYKADTVLKGDVYTGVLNFSMPGAWYVNVKVEGAGRTDTVKLNVDVR